MSTRATVRVHIYDTDEATWDALSRAFEVKSGESATWVTLEDASTGTEVTFFKAKGERDERVDDPDTEDGQDDA